MPGLTYKEIRQRYNSSRLFEDNDFPADDKSLFFSMRPPQKFVWKRPHELCQDPKLFVGGASRFDIEQGQLGDCWFLAALASLSLDDYLLKKVCPEDDQDFGRNYCGAFRFYFWQYGKWQEVVVDDRLPTYNGQLVFVHSSEKNEFWSALLEKAYAKLHSSYEALKGGNTLEAMEDFTGGFSESHDLKKAPKNLFKIMFDAYNHDSQMGCSIDANPNEIEAKLDNGLIKGHAYTITDVRRVAIPGYGSTKPVRLIRIRNPWGQKEWNGRWSDNSSEWRSIPDSERRRLGLVTEDDGEFWMEYTDFIREYNRVDICHLDPTKAPGGKRKSKKWVTNEIDGRWQKHTSAGGCRNFPDTFWVNPQIEMKLSEIDDDDDDDDDDDSPAAKQKGCTVMIGLMQKHRRKQMKMGVGNLTIGFAIYEYKDDKVSKLPKDFFLYNASKARSPTFINTREIMGRFKLPPGRYCIVPSTFEPNQDGDFLLRIYSLKDSSSVTLDEKTGIVDIPREISVTQVSSLQSASPPGPEKKSAETIAAEDAMKTKFLDFFKKITGDDMEVDAWELQEILNAALKKDTEGGELAGSDGFSIDACKSIVAACDEDRSGKLGFEEFMDVWMNIRKWKLVFQKYDQDKSGSFNTMELRDALRSIGYSVSNQTLGALVLRFANKKGLINFDEFISCVIKLKHLIESFQRNSSRGLAQYKLDEFLAVGMYS
ncbi:calpain-B-like isoform X2 [Acanthaster planci]|uniref:Calpain-B-like isoform X2 n=1 Tax=Acanthaster planci TaxID=133434 RepID=A0A8B7Y199_ACAPL|nr:calpain-B-like isoform X2 [Acanthaster planci]